MKTFCYLHLLLLLLVSMPVYGQNVHGVWKAYKNGKNVANYVDFSKPGSNGFNYEKNKPQNMINGKQ